MSFLKSFFNNLKSKDKENVTKVVKKNPECDIKEGGPIITIAREFGSGGREIGVKASQKLNYKLYDKEEIIRIARERGIDTELFGQVDEKNMDKFWFTVSKMAYDIPSESESFEEKVANDKMFMIQSDTIRELSKKGSAIFVGRCASYILKNSAKRVFIIANFDDRVKRIRERYKLSKNEAINLIKTADKKREKYYDYYTNTKWNDVNNYDLVINVSETGIEGAVEKICALVQID